MGRRLLILRLTDRCNNRCRHCFSSSGQPGRGEITLEQACQTMERLIPEGFGRVVLTGGEPLLRRDFCLRFMDWAGNKGVTVGYATNATLIDAELAREMGRSPVEYVQVSLMGAEARTHDAMTLVPGSFRRALDGIRHAVASGMPARVRATYTRDNWREIPRLVELCCIEGVSQFRIKPLIGTGRARNMNEQLPPPHVQLEVNKYLLEVRASGRMDVYFHPPSMEFLSGQVLPHQATPCPCGEDRVCVTASGDIKICGQSDFVLGNALIDDVVKVLRSHPFIQAKRNRITPDACVDCPHWQLCRGGCISATMALGGDWSSPPASCPRLALEIETGEEIT